MLLRLSASVASAAFALALVACLQHGETNSPVRGPEASCAEACRDRAPSCSDSQCARGCRIMMDRLVEHEQPRLIACVARAAKAPKATCDETIFADCAVRVGPMADGGPPPPKDPSDDE